MRWLSLPALLLLALPARAQVHVDIKDDHIAFSVDGGKTLVTRYHTKGFAKPIFYPMYAAGQIPLTRDWPILKDKPGQSTDHPHQKSAWFCHGDILIEGVEITEKIKGVKGVDFWSEAPGHGVMNCVDVGKPTVEKDHAFVVTKNEWRTQSGVKILDEIRTIHFYVIGDAALIVVRSRLMAPTGNITFGDTKEGSFGIRINDQIIAGKKKDGTPTVGKLENAEGKTEEKDIWGLTSAWCDYSGPIDGKVAGLAILDDPKNPYPACWHARGYGLMAANPFGRNGSGFPAMRGKTDLVQIAKGGSLEFRYGMFLHTGDAKSGKVADAYAQFVKLRAAE